MNESTIGIKVADGSYYPILEKGRKVTKRLILTTANENQSTVQIDLYEGEGEALHDARYIGSLLIEDLPPAAKGEPDVELVLGLDDEGTLSANASEKASGAGESLSIRVESLPENGLYDIPEFEFDDESDAWAREAIGSSPGPDEPGPGAVDEDEEEAAVRQTSPLEPTEPKRRPWLVALFIVLAVAAVVVVGILLFRLLQGPEVPPLEANDAGPASVRVAQGETEAGPSEKSREQPAEGAAADGTDSEPAAGAERTSAGGARDRDGPRVVPSDSDIGGVWYWIRWGDTLWGISTSFYQTPWNYGEIASQNEIKDPDLIYAGSRIYIPPK